MRDAPDISRLHETEPMRPNRPGCGFTFGGDCRTRTPNELTHPSAAGIVVEGDEVPMPSSCHRSIPRPSGRSSRIRLNCS